MAVDVRSNRSAHGFLPVDHCVRIQSNAIGMAQRRGLRPGRRVEEPDLLVVAADGDHLEPRREEDLLHPERAGVEVEALELLSAKRVHQHEAVQRGVPDEQRRIVRAPSEVREVLGRNREGRSARP